jgi:isopentenyldiphosphate isomerase
VDSKYDPSQELIDVLNDDGVVVGVTTRREIRKHRLPHRCTYILVFNPAGELLIHQRTETKDVFPGYWDVTVGGVLASGEPWVDGARREALEEIGVDVEPEFLFDFRYRGDFGNVFAKVYRAVHSGPFQLQAEEVTQACFVACSALPALFMERRFCPDGVAVWETFSGGAV